MKQTNGLLGAASCGVGFLTGFLGVNPIGLAALCASNIVPELIRQKKLDKKEEEKLAKEQYENRRMVKDLITGHRWEFKRDATVEDWLAITERYNNGRGENMAKILKDLGLE